MVTSISYREQLKAVFEKKKRSNPRFSLRAFAKSLGLASSSLTEILSGKINLSSERAQRISQKLGLSRSEKEYFLLQVQLESAASPELKELLLEKLKTKVGTTEIHNLSVDLFRTISDWYHFAILEFTYLDPTLCKKKISKAFQIPEVTVELSIKRLLRLELLEIAEDGTYKKSKSRILSDAKVPHEATTKALTQFSELSQRAISNQLLSERFHAIEYLPFSAKNIDQAKTLSEEYIDKMIALSKSTSDRDQVYGLGVQFFNLHHLNQTRK